MTAPKWAAALLRRLAQPGRAEDVLGDLEEAHRKRVQRRGRIFGSLLTGLDALDMAATLMRKRVRRRRMARRRAVSNIGSLRSGRTGRFSWLDFKLGLRMLVKYPGLTVVGGLAIAFAIWVGAAGFEFLNQVVYPTVPLDDGNRIVSIQNRNVAAGGRLRRSLHDFVTWREELRSVEELGAFRTFRRNLVTEHGGGEPIDVVEISASAFRVARVPPLLGRSLVEADERVGAPPVVVIGHRVWQARFGGDPDVVGQTVGLGRWQGTLVGVMPEDFAFPVSDNLWIPLRVNVADYDRGQGPAIMVFGRLADGVTIDEAQAELTTLGRRAAADFPATHEHLRPEIMPYPNMFLNLSGKESAGILSVNLFLVMLLVLVCGNVALLMFARAAARESELVVRNALGASRARIIAQLFTEALVLGGVGALVGLAAANAGLRWCIGIAENQFMDGGRLPFWFSDSVSLSTVLYVVVLTVLGAVIAGVVPAIKATGRAVDSRLRQSTAGVQFGGIWTAVIVTQVAVTVAFPAVAFFVRRDAVQIRSIDVGFAAEEYLAVRLGIDRESPAGTSIDQTPAAFLERFRSVATELEERLTADPAVAGVTFADRFPRMYHPHRRVELDGGEAAPLDPRWSGYRVSSASVAPDYFDVLATRIVSGRGFNTGDLESHQGVVIVNESFVDRVLGGRNPIGRRVRYLYFEESGPARSDDEDPGPWYQIVGVVPDLGMALEQDPKVAGFYHPVPPGRTSPVHMAVHVRGDPTSFAPRLRATAAAVDPALRLDKVQSLDDVHRDSLEFYAFWFWLTVLVSGVALLLSTAGIYSVMAFTVSRRTREIGIRVALGSDRRRVVAAIFRRPLTQIGLGLVVGGGVVTFFVRAIMGPMSVREVSLLAVYAMLMTGVCVVACVVPTRRALRVEPTEALREEG